MKIIEQFIKGKFDDPNLCEDDIFITKNYIVVVDGATSKGEIVFNKMKSGKAITKTILQYFEKQTKSLSGKVLIDSLTNFIQQNLLAEHNLKVKSKNIPSASIGVYNKNNKVLTIVGDISVKIDENIFYQKSKFDEVMADTRSIAYHLLENSMEVEKKSLDDGRNFILPLLENQHKFRNSASRSLWAYGNLDGYPVPDKFIKTYNLIKGQIVILFTDGYPEIFETLEKSEKMLKQLIDNDPMLINNFKSTKGVYGNQVSFDDRAFIKFEV